MRSFHGTLKSEDFPPITWSVLAGQPVYRFRKARGAPWAQTRTSDGVEHDAAKGQRKPHDRIRHLHPDDSIEKLPAVATGDGLHLHMNAAVSLSRNSSAVAALGAFIPV